MKEEMEDAGVDFEHQSSLFGDFPPKVPALQIAVLSAFRAVSRRDN